MIKEKCYRKMKVTVRPDEYNIFLNVNICNKRNGKVVKQSRCIFFHPLLHTKRRVFQMSSIEIKQENKYSLRLMK